MKYRVSVVLLSLLGCSASFAAHIVTETRSGNTLVKRTDTYANAAGDLRMDERGYGSSSTMSAEASAGSAPSIEYHLGNIEDTTLYQANGEAIVMLEGDICRKMTAHSAPPPGLGVPGMNLGDANKQMADAMSQANTKLAEAMAQARREGMTAEQQRAMEQFTKPFMEQPDIKPRDTLEVTAMNRQTVVGQYSAEGFSVSDQDGVEQHRVWVVPIGQVAGGAQVRNSMLGMFNVYEEYLDKMGGGALMDTGMATMFRKGVLSDKYPVRIEDVSNGQITDTTDVVEANSSGPAVDYYPECTEKDMFGM